MRHSNSEHPLRLGGIQPGVQRSARGAGILLCRDRFERRRPHSTTGQTIEDCFGEAVPARCPLGGQMKDACGDTAIIGKRPLRNFQERCGQLRS